MHIKEGTDIAPITEFWYFSLKSQESADWVISTQGISILNINTRNTVTCEYKSLRKPETNVKLKWLLF